MNETQQSKLEDASTLGLNSPSPRFPKYRFCLPRKAQPPSCALAPYFLFPYTQQTIWDRLFFHTLFCGADIHCCVVETYRLTTLGGTRSDRIHERITPDAEPIANSPRASSSRILHPKNYYTDTLVKCASRVRFDLYWMSLAQLL